MPGITPSKIELRRHDGRTATAYDTVLLILDVWEHFVHNLLAKNAIVANGKTTA